MHLFKIKNDNKINTYVELIKIDKKENLLCLIHDLRKINKRIQSIIDCNFYLQFAHQYDNYNEYISKMDERKILKELYVTLILIDYDDKVKEVLKKYKVVYYRERVVK